MNIAAPKDWKLKPLPSKRTTIALDRTFSAAEMADVRVGFVPAEMEDKWFVYWKDDALFFHRSWTGCCIYVVHFAAEGAGWRATHADVNREPTQYANRDDDLDEKLIHFLVDTLLLRKAG